MPGLAAVLLRPVAAAVFTQAFAELLAADYRPAPATEERAIHGRRVGVAPTPVMPRSGVLTMNRSFPLQSTVSQSNPRAR